MITQHTKGPWMVDTSIKGLIEINDKGGASIVYSEPMFRMGNHEENLANARLIAAAPDLLEALDRIMAAVPGGEVDEDTANALLSQIYDAACAARDKATGQNSVIERKTFPE